VTSRKPYTDPWMGHVLDLPGPKIFLRRLDGDDEDGVETCAMLVDTRAGTGYYPYPCGTPDNRAGVLPIPVRDARQQGRGISGSSGKS
jgi:hypothetical protein